ncbi:hypothetical protein [uncultured Methanobrevibacter sp.]|uniref:hypothetical protein n=1 Tax=uncultured Methanobrevibacter sp. TaxID=253161 RepID=UPI0025E51C0D|nr:hypothetical protein [uncultured Methanobrevibacter sp.]
MRELPFNSNSALFRNKVIAVSRTYNNCVFSSFKVFSIETCYSLLIGFNSIYSVLFASIDLKF